MKVFVTGVGGQLGYDVMNELIKRGHTAVGSDIIDKDDDNYIKLDITDKQAVEKVISERKPDAVIHCAAWTAVDAAEDEENKDKVFAINSNGTRYIAQACKTADCKMIYISTDYVFNGEGTEPWQPDCKDYAPLLHSPYSLGVRQERQELHQDHAGRREEVSRSKGSQ